MLDWKVFFLAGGICFLVLSAVFRGEAEHAAAGRLYRGTVELRGRRAKLTVLLDTGHTLRDVLTGAPVLTVSRAALEGRELGPMTVALSPTPVSGGGCTALWGGERGERCAA